MFKETARILQKKVTLYRFEYDNKSYCYCDFYGKKAINFNGEAYKVAVISNQDIETKNKSPFKDKVIEIELTITDPLYDLALDNQTPLYYKIYEVYLDDPSSYIIRSTGTIRTKKTDQEKLILEGEEPEGMLQVTILDAVFSDQCYYSIYDSFCELKVEEWQYTTKVLGVSLNSLTLTLESLPPDPMVFQGGIVYAPNGNVETIQEINTTAKTITIQNDFKRLVKVGDFVRLAPTCSYTWSICKNTFNNLDNFSGYIYMDETTPFDQNQFKREN